MRVLHIIAERDGAQDSRNAAESLIASMVELDPGVEVAEVDLHAGLPCRQHPAEPWGVADPPSEVAGSVLVELMAADLLVLSVPGSGAAPDGVRWLADVLRGPQARLLRAADRRSGHRVSRRLVVVATRGGPMDGNGVGPTAEPQSEGLLALVRDAFRGADVGEVGLITGERALVGAPGPPAGPIRSGARAWIGRGAHRTRAAAC